ncbi:DUF6247 family protein [Streptomyces sp. NPDC093097]|uniref:DUF6247 family protein n=1 Tax=Streptomyces sp. NPDC093097 TaxID=3366027 RepID=UPI0038018AC5
MSAQPEEAPAPPAPAAAAQLLAQLRDDRRAGTWVPAFERDWATALEASRDTYSLTPLHDVVRTWQLRLAAAPAIDAYLDSDRDETDFVDLDDILDTRRWPVNRGQYASPHKPRRRSPNSPSPPKRRSATS